ncbi:MAG: tRNA (cytidine(34)-2'-O)-methyltransferase [Akkermansiaceae bacterium]|nr:tRNA (cytidine(34)-2'-O)-methyltransferase [Akkermansiaceae bacterium]NNM30512.1 tRNA (cytidine(34)-2'-O)-methyltransferase [Akkermansiaceae bacterium]
MNLVLLHPEIPHNTGAAGRLALATGSTLHLVHPLGFSLEDKHLRRAGLDYWKDVDLRQWESLEALQAAAGGEARFWFLSTKGGPAHWDVRYRADDYLVMGPETRGLPRSLLDSHPGQVLRIPMMRGGTRSLNLATAAAVVLYEAMRQIDPPGFAPTAGEA